MVQSVQGLPSVRLNPDKKQDIIDIITKEFFLIKCILSDKWHLNTEMNGNYLQMIPWIPSVLEGPVDKAVFIYEQHL